MTVGGLLGGAFALVKQHLREIFIWSLIQLVIYGLFYAAMIPFLQSSVANQLAAQDGSPPALPAGIGLFFLAYVVFCIWLLMLFAAVMRMAWNGGSDRAWWLRLGKDEGRLFLLVVIYIIAFFIAEFAVIIVGGILIGLTSFIHVAAGMIVGGLFAIVLIPALIWVSVRLSLIGAITVFEGNLAIAQGWRATKGHFWTLFGTFLVMTLCLLVVEVVLFMIISPSLLGSMATGNGLAANQQMVAMMSSPSPLLIVVFLVGNLLGTYYLAYSFGVLAIAGIKATGHSVKELEELRAGFE